LQLYIKVASVSEESKAASGQFLNFQVSVSGSFSNLLKFLGKLENGPYLAEVTTLNIKNATGKIVSSQESQVLSASDITANFNLKVAAR